MFFVMTLCRSSDLDPGGDANPRGVRRQMLDGDRVRLRQDLQG